MTKFILRWAINTIAFYLAVILMQGRGIELESSWFSIIWLALIFGLVNALLRPLLKLLTCPLIVLSLGLFALVINTFLFWLTSEIGQLVGIRLTVEGFWPAFLGALIVSVVSLVMSLILKDELKGKRHK